jgi:hypothetical protein
MNATQKVELRRSNAAGKHGDKRDRRRRTRAAAKRSAIKESS